MTDKHTPVHADRWQRLRQFTRARIGLGRAGTSLPTAALLQFQLAHAQAIDAVHAPLDVEALNTALANQPELQPILPAQQLTSMADNRESYLQRPDWGRRLSDASSYALQQYREDTPYDLVFVIADGLSSLAVNQHAAALLAKVVGQLNQSERDWRMAPLCVVQQGRVAVGDDIALALNAREVVMLIGERPGLSSPDSLGVYLTYQPRQGIEDAKRNCISNIRPQGLNYDVAAHRCAYLIAQSFARQLSGTALKDRSESTQSANLENQHCFLLPEKR